MSTFIRRLLLVVMVAVATMFVTPRTGNAQVYWGGYGWYTTYSSPYYYNYYAYPYAYYYPPSYFYPATGYAYTTPGYYYGYYQTPYSGWYRSPYYYGTAYRAAHYTSVYHPWGRRLAGVRTYCR